MLKLTAKDFKEKYGITNYLWAKYYDDVIDHLQDYIEFHSQKEGKYIYYIITKELKPYEPFKKKSIRAIKFYEEQTSEIVKKEPLQTGINIARNVIEFNNKFNHKQDTAARYVRPILKSKYQKGKNVWCYLSEDRLQYIPLDEEQLEFLYSCFEKYHKSKETIDKLGEIETQRLEKEISIEEAKEKVFDIHYDNYLLTKVKFKEKYGFDPIRISEYEENAILNENN